MLNTRAIGVAVVGLSLLSLLCSPEAAVAAGSVRAPVSQPDEQPVPQAEAVVSTLQSGLHRAMRASDVQDYDERFAELEPVIKRTHHIAYLGQTILRQQWDGFSKDQKIRFLKVFERLSIANYAARFDSYSGERFRLLSSRRMREGVAFVRTELVKSDGETVSLDYVLRDFDDGWRIINIVADGVSEVATKRTEYGAVIKEGGLDKLINKLEDQIERLESGEEEPISQSD